MKKTPAEPRQATGSKSKTVVRGKYFNALQEHGSNLVLLDPALMPFFPDSASVNKALRAYLEIETTIDNASPHSRSRKKVTLPPEPNISFDPRTGTRPKT